MFGHASLVDDDAQLRSKTKSARLKEAPDANLCLNQCGCITVTHSTQTLICFSCVSIRSIQVFMLSKCCSFRQNVVDFAVVVVGRKCASRTTVLCLHTLSSPALLFVASLHQQATCRHEQIYNHLLTIACSQATPNVHLGRLWNASWLALVFCCVWVWHAVPLWYFVTL